MNHKYWENEKPIVVDAGKNVLRWFEEADKLQISMPNWKTGADESRQGKTVTLDLCAVSECPEAIELLRKILATMDED